MDSVEQFKPGDMVKIVSHKEVEGSRPICYRERLPMHTPLEVKSGVDSDGDCKVYTPDKSDWWYVPAANLRRVSSAEAEVKVGDKVRIRDDYGYGPTQCRGKIATVLEVFDRREGMGVKVNVDVPGVWRQTLYIPKHAELITEQAPTAPLPEITLNGVRYVLAPEQEPEKAEEEREPECGEIWRMSDGRLVAIGQDHDRDTELRAVVLNPRNRGVIISQSGADADRQLKGGKLTFAYPSLAAAVEAGETFT